jgi:hypothetical protein
MGYKDKLVMTEAFWDELYIQLRLRGNGETESGAFLLSKEGSNEIVAALYYDELEPGSLDTGGVHLTQRAFIRLSDYCVDNGLVVRADVHTHPYGSVRQSGIDEENPMVKIKGHVALIVPHFAQPTVCDFNSLGTYEYQGNRFRWTSHHFTEKFHVRKPLDMKRDSVSRLAVAFLERDPMLAMLGQDVFAEIDDMLREYRLLIVCQDSILSSISEQAALLTMINAGKRCFKGGVFVKVGKDAKTLLPGYKQNSLALVAMELGAIVNPTTAPTDCPVVTLGNVPVADGSWGLLVNNWSAGILPPMTSEITLPGDQSFPLGGVFGGALIVGSIFLRVANFDMSIGQDVSGISLWRPDLQWNASEAQGPIPHSFPNKIWALGLGHLGQAYAWVIGHFPFKTPGELEVKLQDDDKVVLGNLDSGMLSEFESIGKPKTRIVAGWLERRGITTRIVERKYDAHYVRQEQDPQILLAGLDNIAARRSFRIADFKAVLDCGLGAGLNFDMVRFNAFPNIALEPSEFWANTSVHNTSPVLEKLSKDIMGCGYTLGIASAFTGCAAACVEIAEVLRGYHQGVKLSHMYFSIRELQSFSYEVVGQYTTEMFSGLCEFIVDKDSQFPINRERERVVVVSGLRISDS